MKFKFCGNIDLPEWLISEITFLTKLSAIRLRMLCNNISNFIVNNGKNYKDIQKSLDDMNFSENEGKIIFSLIDFILRNSIKFDIAENILNNELQQLGLPQENADAITKIYKSNKENLKNKLKEEIFSFNQIKDVNYKISYILADDITDFKNNYINKNLQEGQETKAILNSEYQQFNNIDCRIYLSIEDNKMNTTNFTTKKEVLGKLINDLNKASEMIKKLNES